MNIYGITGYKNAGKTGLTERLVAHFTARGLRVSTVKHAHHSFDLDRPGKDSHRHRAAGAGEVMLVSGNRWALLHELKDAPEPPLEELLAKMAPCDLVLVEGFKSGPQPKIECWRAEVAHPLLYPTDPSVRALACDAPPPDPHDHKARAVMRLDLNDTGAIADFIAADLGL